MKPLRCILAALGLLGWAASVAAAPVARPEGGALAGLEENGTAVFRGIPFAAPPIGMLRWRPPQPAARWTGTRQATRFASACIQGPSPNLAAGVATDEDCLYVNVWTPIGTRPGARLPVLVWIHGGAFRAGSAADPRIAGDTMARRGIVVVSIQYRLGVFGFLSHPALSAESGAHVSGNYGLLDQIAGLRWVKRNAAAFGGDPAKVTVGGLSAGAISAAMLAAAPGAHGLFRAIISMSGGSFAPPRSPPEAGENMEPLAQAKQNGVRFGQSLGAADATGLRRLSPAALLAADSHGVGWPVIDGRTIPGDEHLLYARRRVVDVPLLLGTTADEGYFFSRVRTLADYRSEVARRYGHFASAMLEGYPATTDAQGVRQARDLTRDVMFGWGTWAWAALQARYGSKPSFVYYFDHLAPREDAAQSDAGATHGSDQPYPFGIVHQPRAWTQADHRISDAMGRYFANFVKTGDPNGIGLASWPAFAAAHPQMLHITDDLRAGPYANMHKVLLVDRYMAARRAAGTLGPP